MVFHFILAGFLFDSLGLLVREWILPTGWSARAKSWPRVVFAVIKPEREFTPEAAS